VTPDDELKRLFHAARREAPRAGVRTRALDRARATTSERSPGRLPAFVVMAAAATVVLALAIPRLRAPHVSVGPERLPSAPHTNPTPELPARPPSRAPASTTATPRTNLSAAPARAGQALLPRPAPTLGEELALLQGARETLAAGDPNHALELLDHYARSSPKPRLLDEATVERLEALSRAGRGAEASKLAREFVAKHPGSPLVDRARAFITTPNTSASSPQPGRTP
jgi:hypothetical protein